MYRFHVALHAEPPGATPLRIAWRDGELEVLNVPPELLGAMLPVSFEHACDVLRELPQLYLEPDGSFVYRAADGQQMEQVDGQLVDRGGNLQYVELRGECLPRTFDHLLRAAGWPEQPLMFQLLREGLFVEERVLRLIASKA